MMTRHGEAVRLPVLDDSIQQQSQCIDTFQRYFYSCLLRFDTHHSPLFGFILSVGQTRAGLAGCSAAFGLPVRDAAKGRGGSQGWVYVDWGVGVSGVMSR